MLNPSKFLIWACLAGGIALVSCSYSSNDVVFETKSDSCAFLTPDWYGDSVYSIASYRMVWPTKAGGIDLTSIHDSLLAYAFDTITPDFNRSAEHFFRNGPVDGMSVELQPAAITTARNAEKCNELIALGYVSLLTDRTLVMGIDTYGYFFGAAHGYGTSNYINYSIAEKSPITASVLFEADKMDDVIETVKTVAGERYADGVVNIDDITSVNNFRITPKQVVFVFQPYDIAPYYMGVIEIPVNIYDLYETLTPIGHKMLNI